MKIFDKDKTLLIWASEMGVLETISGLTYYRKGFDASQERDPGTGVWSFRENHLDGSATLSVQPRQVGGLAPGSRPAASNQNGEARYFTHPAISFAANEAWSVSLACNWNGSNATAASVIRTKTGDFGFHFKETSNRFAFRQYTDTAFKYFAANSSNNIIGKLTIITLVADGGGNLSLYKNGVLFETIVCETKCDLTQIIKAYNTAGFEFNGKINYYRIQSGAMTAAQVLSEATFLRTKYPKIESTVIGTQEWSTRNFEAVATPVGNVINNVTVNGAVERVTNAADREFSSDTGWWSKVGGATINDNKLNLLSIADSAAAITKSGLMTVNKWYKFTYTVLRDGGGNIKSDSFSTSSIIPKVVGVNTIYRKAIGTTFHLGRNETCDIDVDDISIQELNWSNATEIYDAVYAVTAGDAATKEYAALKEAAMWCYYNNDAANGAIYGKLYNWYAAKLLDLDMVTASFGWRVPTSAQFTTLANALGGASVAGGKMKMTGTDYWNTPNTGATNESGFTGLGCGQRTVTGTFANIKTNKETWTSDKFIARILYDSAALSLEDLSSFVLCGFSIRLIKV